MYFPYLDSYEEVLWKEVGERWFGIFSIIMSLTIPKFQSEVLSQCTESHHSEVWTSRISKA
jgi:hypothetical protein